MRCCNLQARGFAWPTVKAAAQGTLLPDFKPAFPLKFNGKTHSGWAVSP
jgi:hypothetical protein